MPNDDPVDEISDTLVGINGKLEISKNSARITLFKRKLLTWDSSKPDNIYDLPKGTITKITCEACLGQNQVHIYFPGAGWSGNIILNINKEQLPQAEKVMGMLKNADPPSATENAPQFAGLDSNKTAGAWNDEGVVLLRSRKYNEAIEAFDEAIRLDPKFALAWNNKGIVLELQGKFKEPLKHFEEAVSLDPNLSLAKDSRARFLKKQKIIMKILDKRGASSDNVLLAADGANGQIILTDKGVLIGREGFWKKLVSDSYTKGDKFLPYKSISGVQFKDPGMTWGYIQFTLMGGIESRGGSWDAGKDENTVTFNADKSDVFREIRNIVEERAYQTTIPAHQADPQKNDPVETMKKLKDMLDMGLISQTEYDSKKADLLSRM